MKQKYLLFFILSWILISCNDDESNVVLKDINELEIKGINDQSWYNVIAFSDTLRIYPDITSSLYDGDKDRYEYTWRMIPNSAPSITPGDSVEYIVGNEKNLNLVVNLPADTYRGSYVVKDKENDLKWHKFFYVQVRSLTSEGWMVLCDQSGEARLDVLFNINENENLTSHNLWVNNDFPLGKPQSMLFSYSVHGPSLMYVSDNGTYELDENLNFDESRSLIWKFGPPLKRVDVRATAINQFGGLTKLWVLVDKEGDVYTNNKGLYGSVFEYPVNKINGETYFKAAPFVAANHNWVWAPNVGPSVMLYDETNKQFLEIKDGAEYPSVMRYTNESLFTAKTGRDMVHLEGTKEGLTYAILKDSETGKYYYYCVHMQSESKNDQLRYGEVLGPNLDQVQQFACSHMFPYLFYSIKDKVYQFDMSNPGQPAKEVLSFPGETVKVIKFTPFVAWEPYEDWERNRNFDLLVASTIDSAAMESNGIIRMYNVPNLMGDLKIIQDERGFGNIIDVTYKERGEY